LLNLLLNQARIFFKVLSMSSQFQLVYINTILPFGAAMAAKVCGKKVIYHIHETSVTPLIWKKFLMLIIKLTSSHNIYVSKYLSKKEPLDKCNSSVIYNALPGEFSKIADEYLSKKIEGVPHRILMLCSLKHYKGIDQFYELAKRRPEYIFDLVLNADEEDVVEYYKDKEQIPNLCIYSKRKNVHPFYQQAGLVMNLSIPNLWVETFGMTALEAMQYGLPVIVPPVGGIAEIVEDNLQGYKIDSSKINIILNRIDNLLINSYLYKKMSLNAKKQALRYNQKHFKESIVQVIKNNIIISKASEFTVATY